MAYRDDASLPSRIKQFAAGAPQCLTIISPPPPPPIFPHSLFDIMIIHVCNPFLGSESCTIGGLIMLHNGLVILFVFQCHLFIPFCSCSTNCTISIVDFDDE